MQIALNSKGHTIKNKPTATDIANCSVFVMVASHA